MTNQEKLEIYELFKANEKEINDLVAEIELDNLEKKYLNCCFLTIRKDPDEISLSTKAKRNNHYKCLEIGWLRFRTEKDLLEHLNFNKKTILVFEENIGEIQDRINLYRKEYSKITETHNKERQKLDQKYTEQIDLVSNNLLEFLNLRKYNNDRII